MTIKPRLAIPPDRPLRATAFTEKSSAPTKDWRDRQHKAQQAGPQLTKAETRQQLFEQLEQYARTYGGWLISAPGDPTAMIEVPTWNTTMFDDLKKMGFQVFAAGQGERVCHNAVCEHVTVHSTVPGGHWIDHQGIAKTNLIGINLPRP